MRVIFRASSDGPFQVAQGSFGPLAAAFERLPALPLRAAARERPRAPRRPDDRRLRFEAGSSCP
eukprot:10695007-Alexandrium_andersonii.AAC.1